MKLLIMWGLNMILKKMEEQEADVMLPEMRKASWLIRQKKTNGPNVVPTILVEHII